MRAVPIPDADMGRQRAAVDTFLTAAWHDDLNALIATLASDIVLNAEVGGAVKHYRCAPVVAEQAMAFSSRTEYARPALITAPPCLAVTADGQPIAVLAFTVADGMTIEPDIYTDSRRLNKLEPAIFIGDAKDPSDKP